MNRERKILNKSNIRGQALIELCVCMVAVIVLISAMLEFMYINKAQTDTMVAARAIAGAQAMADGPALPAPPYLYDWEPTIYHTTYKVKHETFYTYHTNRYCPGDTPVSGDSATLHSMIVEETVSDASEWSIIAERPNYMYDLHNASMGPSVIFGMVNGSTSTNVNLISAFQKLVYRKNSIDIESQVWMTWTKGIY